MVFRAMAASRVRLWISTPCIGAGSAALTLEHDLSRKPVPTFRDHALAAVVPFWSCPDMIADARGDETSRLQKMEGDEPPMRRRAARNDSRPARSGRCRGSRRSG